MKTLYKKTATGAIQQWKIGVKASTIITKFGQVDGKQQITKDVVKAGKNIGKKTETTPEEQALAEAKAKFQKQLKKGYVKSIEKAEAEQTNEIITGGWLPMTAKSFFKYDDKTLKNIPTSDAKHIKYPCAVQPKLDGIRNCMDKEHPFSRTRKPIGTIPHIVKALKEIEPLKFDGELYNHEHKDNFEVISSMVRREKELHPDHKLIQYHIYDINTTMTFQKRIKALQLYKKLMEKSGHIKIVETRICANKEELMEAYEDFLEQGYEGAMVRNLHDSPYESKRSKHLQKMKLFEDDEFKVVGIKEGRGKLAGHVGSFICEVKDKRGKRTFDCKLKGKTSELKKYFNDESLWKNKMMTVRFQGYTKKNFVPRIPVGIRFRDMSY